ncbi:MAG: hypothetical protein V4629_05285, partial [Pseudomonadota bacterium]
MLDSSPSLNVVSKIPLNVQNGAKTEVKAEMESQNNNSETPEKIAFKDVIKEVLQDENKKNDSDEMNNEAAADVISEEAVLNNFIPASVIPTVANEIVKVKTGNDFPPLNIAATLIPATHANQLKISPSDFIFEPVIEKEFITNLPSDNNVPQLKIDKSKIESLSPSSTQSNAKLPDVKNPGLNISNSIASELNILDENSSELADIIK